MYLVDQIANIDDNEIIRIEWRIFSYLSNKTKIVFGITH